MGILDTKDFLDAVERMQQRSGKISMRHSLSLLRVSPKENKMEALKRIASRVWKFGESKFPGSGCFVDSDFNEGYNDDDIIDKYNATHYDTKWEGER